MWRDFFTQNWRNSDTWSNRVWFESDVLNFQGWTCPWKTWHPLHLLSLSYFIFFKYYIIFCLHRSNLLRKCTSFLIQAVLDGQRPLELWITHMSTFVVCRKYLVSYMWNLIDTLDKCLVFVKCVTRAMADPKFERCGPTLNKIFFRYKQGAKCAQKKNQFIHLVGLLYTLQQISSYAKTNEWYRENLSNDVDATCQDIPSMHYTTHFSKHKRDRANIWRVIRRPSYVYFSNLDGPETTLVPFSIRPCTQARSRTLMFKFFIYDTFFTYK